jgi:hypothetical protein
LAYLKGIVGSTPRKNGWHLAEHAGEARPDGMQRLLNSAVWDEDLVRDESLVPTSWSGSVIPMPSWSLMRPVFAKEGKVSWDNAAM